MWATPYELLHGEPFPDASIIVPFGCAALVLLDEKDLSKFTSRCALMVFIHYADEHPLYTYAFYSPRTKRVLYRQDCIFLTGVFPMRNARRAAGLNPDGEQLLPFRSPLSMRGVGPSSYSFDNWKVDDPLPQYEDHVSGVPLAQPSSIMTMPSSSQTKFDNGTFHFPFHPAFGPASVVHVRPPTGLHDAGNDSESTTSGPGESSSGVVNDGSPSFSRALPLESPAIPTDPQDFSSDDGEDDPLAPSLPFSSGAPRFYESNGIACALI